MNDVNDDDSEDELRESLDRAASGAPAAGWAVRDRFSANEIFERILASAAQEIGAPKQQLFFSGLAAGFAIVLTFLGHIIGMEMFPDNRFLSSILYPVGFMYIILGHYQLYTENTLPPVALALARLASIPLLMRVWVVVLIGNIVGAALGAYLLVYGGVLSPEALQTGTTFVSSGLDHEWWSIFNRALFAGWLVAGVVWLDHAARDTISRLFVIYVSFYLIAAADLYHVITAASEAFYFLLTTDSGVFVVFSQYWLPILLGNTIGGVFLLTLVNYAQTEQSRYPGIRELTIRELLFSWRGGTDARPSEETGDASTDTES